MLTFDEKVLIRDIIQHTSHQALRPEPSSILGVWVCDELGHPTPKGEMVQIQIGREFLYMSRNLYRGTASYIKEHVYGL